jgi:hypothetical protein
MYQLFIQIIKYGFSTVLFGVGLYVLIASYREHKSFRRLFKGFAITAYFLFAAGMTLLIFTGETAAQLSMFFIKAISTAFGLLYGIYATLNGFMETDPATGKKTVTRLGVLGIFILSFNTILLVSMDYLQETAAMEEKLQEKQLQLDQERERKIEYERLLGSVSFVDRKTGDLKIDFEKFSESLYRSLVTVETDLRNTRIELATRETELKDATARWNAADAGAKVLQETLSKTEKALATRDAELKESQTKLAQSDASLKAAQENLAKTEKSLAGREAELKNTSDQLVESQKEAKKAEEELSRTSRDLASKDAEAREQTRRATAAESSLARAQDELKKSAAAFTTRDAEARQYQKENLNLQTNLARETEERSKLDKLLAARDAELRACKTPPATPTPPQPVPPG